MPTRVESLIKKYFSFGEYVLPEQYNEFYKFIDEAETHKSFLIRPEVIEKIDGHIESFSLQQLSKEFKPDYSVVKAKLFDYQKESILFALFKAGSIIADEMGLGKTLQAITIAILKKELFNFKRTLVICPASLKYQWKKEIEKFSDEKALIIEGTRESRHSIYKNSETYFIIANYEAVMRDVTLIQNYPPDMIILDEAQKIKNYETKTSHAVKSIPRKHALVITGTPLENNLLDLYSIMNFIKPEILAPQWEFSMNHCYFDKSKKNRITGYFDLQKLKKKLEDYIIRREKADVLKELPAVQEVHVPIVLSDAQKEIHAGLAQSLYPILHKKHKTIYDMQRIQRILTSMRMVCDSTFLIDKTTNQSPKLEELESILFEKLDIINRKKKVIIFSEWKTMLDLISKMLGLHNVIHVTLSGDVPVNKRGALIEEFEKNRDCLIFLSTEAGGTGLNLQFADTVINFDLPWNPAKKNQRIGRINRLGQESTKLTAINLVAIDSIEQNIANGIVLKEELFNAVLNEGNLTDEVDFSAKGRTTLIEQVEKLLKQPESIGKDEDNEGIEISDNISALEIEETENIDGIITEDNEKLLAISDKKPETKIASAPEEIEATLNQGMQFLNGIFKMATGKEFITGSGAINVNKETGEVVFKFKLPGF
ncbi:MAG: DEAD/DEAH box helicase [bacterium]